MEVIDAGGSMISCRMASSQPFMSEFGRRPKNRPRPDPVRREREAARQVAVDREAALAIIETRKLCLVQAVAAYKGGDPPLASRVLETAGHFEEWVLRGMLRVDEPPVDKRPQKGDNSTPGS